MVARDYSQGLSKMGVVKKEQRERILGIVQYFDYGGRYKDLHKVTTV